MKFFAKLNRLVKMAAVAAVVGTSLLAIPGGAAHAAALPPIAQDDLVVTSENVPVSGNVLDNDVNGVRMMPVDLPFHGQLLWQPNGTFTYQSERNYVGTDIFIYELYDDAGQQSLSQGVVVITVAPLDPEGALSSSIESMAISMHTMMNQMRATAAERAAANRASDLSALQTQAARMRLSAQQALAAATVQGAVQIGGGVKSANTGLKYADMGLKFANAVLAMPVPQSSKPRTDVQLMVHCMLVGFTTTNPACMP